MARPTPQDGRRVAVVQHFFPHYRAALMRALLASTRHRYLLVGDRDNPFADGIEPWALPPDVPLVHTPSLWLPGGILWQKGLLRLALRRDLDVIIHVGNPRCPATWLSAVLARLAGKRVLFWTIGWYHEDSRFNTLVKRLFFSLAHGLLLYGHLGKVIALANGFAPERLYVVYNSLDYARQRAVRDRIGPAEVAALRAELFARPDWPIVNCTSRLTAKRQLGLLIEALARLQSEGHPLNLLLVGDGPERPVLEQQAARLGVPVKFYGACYDEETLGRLLLASRVTAAPGMVGLTAMHSLAYGVPVLTHDDPLRQSPEFEVVVPGRTGDLFRQGDVADLAGALRRWTAGVEVPAEVRAACQRGVERAFVPEFQRRVFDRAVAGLPADDLFWQRKTDA